MSIPKLLNNTTDKIGDELKKDLKSGAKVSVAASIFSMYGYNSLKKELSDIDELRFIFTDPTFIEAEKTSREQKLFEIRSDKKKQSVGGSEFEINLKNELTGRAIAKECKKWIEQKVKFKSNIHGGIHSNLVIDNKDESTVYLPLDEFSSAGFGYESDGVILRGTTKLSGKELTQQYLNNFNNLWNDPKALKDVTDEVVDYISNLYKENPPSFIYYFTLYNIFNEFLENIIEDELPNEKTGFKESQIWNILYDFQKDAVIGIINKLERYNGCILADSVGLGKTFTTLGVIKYYQERNQNILVLCPKKLGDNWQTYTKTYYDNPLIKDRFNYDVLFHTDLSREFGRSGEIDLSRINWGNYDLVVIDESHNFRNKNNSSTDEGKKKTRYDKLLDDVMKAGVQTKVLMLSATPVNNELSDLKNQIALAYEGKTNQIDENIDPKYSIDSIIKRAQTTFNQWSKLPAEERTTAELLNRLSSHFDFFKLLDSITIARSRKHIQKYYDMSQIGQFPNRLKPVPLNPEITDLPDFMDMSEVADKLLKLSLAVYSPTNYILIGKQDYYSDLYDTKVTDRVSFQQSTREMSLKKLIFTNLLKRLESSVHSFRLTLSSLQQNIEENLQKISAFETNHSSQAGSFNTITEEDDEDSIIGQKVQIKLEDMDTLTWKRDLEADLAIINSILLEMTRVTPEQDSKLRALKNIIEYKQKHPINPNNKKILIFTAFADTAEYLYEHISVYAKNNLNLEVAQIIGSGNNKSTLNIGSDFNTLLTFFSPKSKKRQDKYQDYPEIDILIATDCISEGQNLQDCDYLVNYDIHWNPVRIIQRFGRIDRIGSQNKDIQLVNFWPSIDLDSYIDLKNRVENRMTMVNVSTGEDNVLNNSSVDLEFRKKQLQKLQNEVIDLEDMDTGVSITDLGLNDFRMDLIGKANDLKTYQNMPTGMHAVCKAKPEINANPGVIFILKNRRNEININNINQLHPFYLVYISQDGEIVVNHLNVKKTLDIMRAIARNDNTPIPEVYQPFNQETDDGNNMQEYSELLDQAIDSIINLKEETDLDSLFRPGGTTFTRQNVQGLEDFELISFLIVR
jgi:SNF2 family DNA or RNA helicase